MPSELNRDDALGCALARQDATVRGLQSCSDDAGEPLAFVLERNEDGIVIARTPIDPYQVNEDYVVEAMKNGFEVEEVVPMPTQQPTPPDLSLPPQQQSSVRELQAALWQTKKVYARRRFAPGKQPCTRRSGVERRPASRRRVARVGSRRGPPRPADDPEPALALRGRLRR